MAYLSANSVEAALEALQNDQMAIVAGCTDWFPSLGQKPAPTDILDISGIEEIVGITRVADGWRFGAATTWAEVANADLPACFDGLKAAAREIGSVQIQNAGTLGGNICNASPAADGVPPLLALGAQVEIVSASGARSVALEEFITGVRTTDLRRGEMVRAVIIPNISATSGSSFVKLGSRKYLVISIAMAAAVIDLDANGCVCSARVAIGACSPVAQRQPKLESALLGLNRGELAAADLINVDKLSSLSPISDVRGDADFRIDVVAKLCQRAIMRAATERRGNE